MYEKIRELAKKKGWSMSFLSRQLGLSASYFTDIKSGKAGIPAERVAQIAELLDTTPEYLLGNTDDPARPGSLTENQREAMRLFEQLSDEDAATALAVLQSLAKK